MAQRLTYYGVEWLGHEYRHTVATSDVISM